MVEIIVFIIVVNIVFEILKLISPHSRLTGFVQSFLSILVLYLICLKIKVFVGL